MKPTLIIFVKEPRPGRVKTRLARDVGAVAAALWYRRQCAALLRRLGQDRRWRTVLAVSPDTAVRSPCWPPGLRRIRQGRGTLGARMARALSAASPGPVLLIGSDVPRIGPNDIAAAFAALRGAGAVLGPSRDGGFWLIGLAQGKRLPRGRADGVGSGSTGPLEPVRWSSPHALKDTVTRLRPLSVSYTATRDDVDEFADLTRLGLPRP
ncbi:MAG: DUF2064 domain-containing protein [Pseudomonadota bacterium]